MLASLGLLLFGIFWIVGNSAPVELPTNVPSQSDYTQQAASAGDGQCVEAADGTCLPPFE